MTIPTLSVLDIGELTYLRIELKEGDIMRVELTPAQLEELAELIIKKSTPVNKE